MRPGDGRGRLEGAGSRRKQEAEAVPAACRPCPEVVATCAPRLLLHSPRTARAGGPTALTRQPGLPSTPMLARLPCSRRLSVAIARKQAVCTCDNPPPCLHVQTACLLAVPCPPHLCLTLFAATACHGLTQTQRDTLTHSLSHSLTHSHTHSHSLTLTLTHTHSHSHSLTHAHTRSPGAAGAWPGLDKGPRERSSHQEPFLARAACRAALRLRYLTHAHHLPPSPALLTRQCSARARACSTRRQTCAHLQRRRVHAPAARGEVLQLGAGRAP